jgi:transposase
VGDLEIIKRLEDLEQRHAQMASQITALAKERDEYHQLYLQMMERNRELERGILRSKSEHLQPSDGQLALSVIGMMLGDRERAAIEAAQSETLMVPEHTRSKPTGRKPIPDDLPRVVIEVLPSDVQKLGLDAFERIGEEVSETIERRPQSLVVVRHVRGKFVLKDRDRDAPTNVLIADPPELPIQKGLAGPGMLADTIVRRWQDHLPLNRLEGIYSREGIELARSTMCGWHFELAKLVEPLLAAMHRDAIKQPYICTDSTGVLVQQAEKCRTGHFWVLVAPLRHVLFEYTSKHDSDAVDRVLAGYEGYVVADAHAVYDHLYKSGDVVEVNCWAHCRRYFFKAMTSDPTRAQTALDLIGMLFKIERTIADSPRKKKEAIRKKRSKPIVDSFLSWCDAEAAHVLDDTPISDGIRYARNQRVGLSRFIEDGRLPIHNNMSELNLRREAVGRKNWLFVGSDEGGEVNAAFTSLLASCQLCGIEPWAYLRDIFCLLPSWSEHRVLELSPIEWTSTRKRDDVRTLLEGNTFRSATLDTGR